MARSNNRAANTRKQTSVGSTAPIGGSLVPPTDDGRARGEQRAGTPAQNRELRARGRRTMRKLLDAGVTVFTQRGYHAARVDDIVKVAKTSHGTFYLYFSNKEDLFRALAVDVAGEMVALAESLPAIDTGDSGYQQLRAWLERFAELYEHYGPVVRAWTEAEIGGSEFGGLGSEVLADFSRTLASRIRETGPADIDPEVAALAVVAMIERFNYYLLFRHVRVSRDAMLDTLATVMHAGLFQGRRSHSSRNVPATRRS